MTRAEGPRTLEQQELYDWDEVGRTEGIRRAARAYAYALAANANRSPRELAEEIARGATETRTVDQIEDDIRASRGLPPLRE